MDTHKGIFDAKCRICNSIDFSVWGNRDIGITKSFLGSHPFSHNKGYTTNINQHLLLAWILPIWLPMPALGSSIFFRLLKRVLLLEYLRVSGMLCIPRFLCITVICERAFRACKMSTFIVLFTFLPVPENCVSIHRVTA